MTQSLRGQKIRNYKIVSLLGKGGMGEVYSAYDEKLERRVALKSIHRGRRLDVKAKTRFLREARVLSQLEHPNICRIHDYIETVDGDFLVLELIDGRSLTQAIKRGLDERQKLIAALAQVLVRK